jgi:hypothetical protein
MAARQAAQPGWAEFAGPRPTRRGKGLEEHQDELDRDAQRDERRDELPVDDLQIITQAVHCPIFLPPREIDPLSPSESIPALQLEESSFFIRIGA